MITKLYTSHFDYFTHILASQTIVNKQLNKPKQLVLVLCLLVDNQVFMHSRINAEKTLLPFTHKFGRYLGFFKPSQISSAKVLKF